MSFSPTPPPVRRRKFVRDTEQRYWEHVTPSSMTEESDSETSDKIVTHQLLWRSECESVATDTQPHQFCLLGILVIHVVYI